MQKKIKDLHNRINERQVCFLEGYDYSVWKTDFLTMIIECTEPSVSHKRCIGAFNSGMKRYYTEIGFLNRQGVF